MSWLESISRQDISVEAQKGYTMTNPIEQTQKCHTKSNLMWLGPNHNGIILSWVDSNQHSRRFFESWVELNQNLNFFESWVDLNQNSGKLLESCVKLNRISGERVDLNQIPEDHFESCVDSNQFLKAIVSHEVSQNKNFLRLSWIESKNKSCQFIPRITWRSTYNVRGQM